MGRIIHFSGPHVGCMHDKYLYDTFHPPFQQGELCLGDLGCDEHIITPHKRSRNQPVLDLPQFVLVRAPGALTNDRRDSEGWSFHLIETLAEEYDDYVFEPDQ
eukprot:TRINITY_DN768_c1_g1_i4.p1 TRINITY_DN768_c1_g1~~TRINITY_DN768_c1_g1_i4.p1  ORF type:complete len:103 (-),score=20.06 TRINITY_DN768_c1_g1_i4:345-653(-)